MRIKHCDDTEKCEDVRELFKPTDNDRYNGKHLGRCMRQRSETLIKEKGI